MKPDDLTVDKQILDFYRSLNPEFPLPNRVHLMNPFLEQETYRACAEFYHRYYRDRRTRIILFGINPGRFGAGVTGVPFTDPIRLEEICGIKNDFDKKPELSSEFVYDMIEAYGGVNRFYSDFFISAVCPLGFTQDGKNLNYYDDKDLLRKSEPFIVKSIHQQLEIFDSNKVAFSLGKGKNFQYFTKINEKYHFFEEIKALPHPRWVMQYRRKKKDNFINEYVDQLRAVVQ